MGNSIFTGGTPAAPGPRDSLVDFNVDIGAVLDRLNANKTRTAQEAFLLQQPSGTTGSSPALDKFRNMTPADRANLLRDPEALKTLFSSLNPAGVNVNAGDTRVETNPDGTQKSVFTAPKDQVVSAGATVARTGADGTTTGTFTAPQQTVVSAGQRIFQTAGGANGAGTPKEVANVPETDPAIIRLMGFRDQAVAAGNGARANEIQRQIDNQNLQGLPADMALADWANTMPANDPRKSSADRLMLARLGTVEAPDLVAIYDAKDDALRFYDKKTQAKELALLQGKDGYAPVTINIQPSNLEGAKPAAADTSALEGQYSAVSQFYATANDLIGTVRGDPTALRTKGYVPVLNSIANAVKGGFDLVFNGAKLDPAAYEAKINETYGGEAKKIADSINARLGGAPADAAIIQQKLIELAFLYAQSVGQQNRSVSNNDFAQFLTGVSGNSKDPDVLESTVQSAAAGLQTRFAANLKAYNVFYGDRMGKVTPPSFAEYPNLQPKTKTPAPDAAAPAPVGDVSAQATAAKATVAQLSAADPTGKKAIAFMNTLSPEVLQAIVGAK